MTGRHDHAKRRRIIVLDASGEIRVAEAARALGVHPATVARQVRALGTEPSGAWAEYLREPVERAAAASRPTGLNGPRRRERYLPDIYALTSNTRGTALPK
jgi:hypothetical protein